MKWTCVIGCTWLLGCAGSEEWVRPQAPCAVGDAPLVVVAEDSAAAVPEHRREEPRPRARSISLGHIGDAPLSGGVTRETVVTQPERQWYGPTRQTWQRSMRKPNPYAYSYNYR